MNFVNNAHPATPTTRQRGEATLAILALLALVGLGISQLKTGSAPSPTAVLQTMQHNAQPGWTVSLEVTPAPLRIGLDSARLRVTSARPGYLTLFQAGTDGKQLNVVFPNALDPNNHIDAGVTELPRSGWALAARGPAGEGSLLAVVSTAALDAEVLRGQLAAGKTPVVEGGYGAASASWREVWRDIPATPEAPR